jgi:hypothetical protein
MAVDGYLILLKHAKWLIRPPAAQASQMTIFSLVEVSFEDFVLFKKKEIRVAWCNTNEYY